MRTGAKKITTRIIIFLLVAGALAAVYIYREYNRKLPDTMNMKADQVITGDELIAAFEKNDSLAGKRFMDQVIQVSGKVRELQEESGGLLTVVLGGEQNASAVRCSVDSIHRDGFRNIRNGQSITLKGICTGFNKDELLGSDVVLVRCVITNNN